MRLPERAVPAQKDDRLRILNTPRKGAPLVG
ncbi:hypothetical protein BN126360115 [Stenotrophomonas thermophila]|nr:hypothetical protein BN126360115 [Stenotrophomonas maltophilia]